MKGGEEPISVEQREYEQRERERVARARQEQLARARDNQIAADTAARYHRRYRDNSLSFPCPCAIMGGRIKNKSNKSKSKRVNKRVKKRYSRKSSRKSLKK